MFRWLRDFARAKTLFIDPQYAAQIKNKFSLTYAFIGWNLFGIVIYSLYKQNLPDTQDSIDYAKLYGVKDSKVVKFVGFKKVEEFELQVSDEELDEFKNVIGSVEGKKLYDEKNEERRKEAQIAKEKLSNR